MLTCPFVGKIIGVIAFYIYILRFIFDGVFISTKVPVPALYIRNFMPSISVFLLDASCKARLVLSTSANSMNPNRFSEDFL